MTMEASQLCNMCVPLSDKSDGGASSLTLRDLLEERDIVDPMFPVVLTGATVNTQGSHTGYSFPQYAPNNKDEYAVMDIAGIELEDGEIFEKTFATNDIQPITEDGAPISNDDRIKATQTLYNSAVRFLKNSRRRLEFNFPVADLPNDVNVLDRIKFKISSYFPDYDACMTDYEKEIYSVDDWFYITNIGMSYGDYGWSYTLTIAKDIAGIYGNGVN